MAKTSFTLCPACGEAHAPHHACRQSALMTMEEERRKSKGIKTKLRPRYIAQFKQPKNHQKGRR